MGEVRSNAVSRSLEPVAVQISNLDSHHATPGQSGAVGLAVFVIGLALICYGVIPTLRAHRWRALAVSARGRVIDNLPRRSHRGTTIWSPLIEFQAAGITVLSHVPSAASRRGRPLGAPVDVLYDPADPHRAGLADVGLSISGWLIAGLAVVGVYLALVT
jgi:hypothetical protein